MSTNESDTAAEHSANAENLYKKVYMSQCTSFQKSIFPNDHQISKLVSVLVCTDECLLL